MGQVPANAVRALFAAPGSLADKRQQLRECVDAGLMQVRQQIRHICDRVLWLLRPIPALTAAPGPRLGTAIESLENRQLLSSVSFSGGILNLVGDPSSENQLTVNLGSDQTLAANANGHWMQVAESAVRQINITGGSAADDVWINPGVTVPANIQEYGGNDLIKAVGAQETIHGGDGSDNIHSNGTIMLGNGNNSVYIGAGSSYVKAGNGNNLLVGGGGNDTLIAGSGHSTLIGGDGADVLQGGPNTVFQNVYPRDSVNGSNVVTPVSGSGGSAGGSNSPIPQPVPPATPPANGPEDLTVTGSNHGDSQAPVPVIHVMGTVGQAEQSVFVNARQSTLGAGTVLTTNYQWNFGDPGGQYNLLPGWNAGHIYDRPGTYTITLTITNSLGKSSSVSAQVTVSPSTRRTVYVDTNGSDSNSGTSPSQAVRSVDRINQLLADNTTVLFRRGETFPIGNSIVAPFKNDVFGAYGAGAAPILMKVDGGGIGDFSLYNTSDQTVIENLTFDSPAAPRGNIADHIPRDTAIFAGGRNTTIRNNTFLNVDNAVDSYRGPVGLLLENNNAPDPTGIRGYFEYIQGDNHVLLGNSVANSTREHVVRSSDQHTSDILIAYNNFTNLTRATVDPGDFTKTTINFRAGQYIYIYGNTLHDGPLGFGPDEQMDPTANISWVVINGNVIDGTQIHLQYAADHFMISNNVINLSATEQIAFDPNDPAYPSRQMTDITITHNTGIDDGPYGSFFLIHGDGPAGIITVTNNLWLAPGVVPGADVSAPISVHGDSLSVFKLINHNVWPGNVGTWKPIAGGVMFVSFSLNSTNYLSIPQWENEPMVGADEFKTYGLGSSYSVPTDFGDTAGAVLPPGVG